MARPKGAKNKTKTKTTERKDPRIQNVYETEVEFMCPVRGLVKQKVKVKKFKQPSSEQRFPLPTSSDSLSAIEEKEGDGLSIYQEDEEAT
jgi:hypothetical protein